jgi:hypothetical protein
LVAECGAFVAVGPEETELYQLIAVQRALQFLEERGREPGATDLERRFKPLAETTKVGFLCAGKREVVHKGR